MQRFTPRGNNDPSGRRARSRLRVRLPARLETVSSTCSVVLCDLSLTGAKVSIDTEPRTGRDCLLTWENAAAFGRIVWARGGFAGIAFDELLTPRTLIATRDLQDVDPLPGDGELDRYGAREWVQGIGR